MYSHSLKAIATSLFIFVSYSPALADDQLSAIHSLDLQQLGELHITTASLFYSYTLNAPASVNVITQSHWQRNGARYMSDALGHIAGVQTIPSLAGANAIAIRGYTRSTSIIGVATTWDGVPLGDFFRGAPQLILPNINLGVLDEIQLVQGPGSALYGSDAFHGVLALKGYAAESREKRISGSLYSDGYYNSDFRVGISTFNGGNMSIALSASGQPDQDRRFQFNDPDSDQIRTGELDNHYQGQSLSAKFSGNPDAALVFDGGLYLHRYRSEDFQGFGTRLSGTRSQGGIDTDFAMARLGATQNFSDTRSLSFSAFYWLADSTLTAGRETPTVFDFESVSEQQRYGVQAQWRDNFESINTRGALVAGIEEMAVNKAGTNTYTTDGEVISSVTNPAEGSKRRINSLTFEGNTIWADERWRLTYGARYDHYSDFGSQTSPRLGVIYHPTMNSAVKLLYGHAFRAPTANELRGTPGLVAGNLDLQPEVIDTYELIFIRRTPRFFVQATLFSSQWKDGIVSIANDGGEPFIFENVERNAAEGLLLTFKRDYNPFLIELDIGWVESKNKTLDQNYKAFPKYTLDFGLSYRSRTLNTEFKLTQSLRFDTEDLYPPSSGIPAEQLPTYRRTDVSAFTPLNKQTELRLFIHNLFDEDNFQPSTTGARGGIPDEPFTVGVELSYAL